MSTIAPLAVRLCDDAAVFPPGNAPLDSALARHRAHRAAWYADLVGPLVLPAAALDELDPLLAEGPGDPLAITLTVGAPDQLAAAVAGAAARAVLDLRSVEVPLGDTEPDLAGRLIRQATADAAIGVAVEVPRDDAVAHGSVAPSRRRAAALDLIADHADAGWIAKFRTGGVRADLHPGSAELAAAIAECAARDLAFKATAGLHHAVRHTDPATGFDQHGFANLLVATQRGIDGADVAEIAAVLDLDDGTALAAALSGLGPDEVVRLRARFRSFGTCSITEPLADLRGLGLLGPDPTDSTDPDRPDPRSSS